ncbi:NIPSNAP family protein [Roseomonas fluvialis]|uniref:NIPSNAP family protein n=1 Tax=Roseomonas fluvialis TaxID=1750527 RepID=A0ABM7Y1N7_9PROT|nr:NIPSNAP family protein [Roseomonas fluvialis]BDG71726.1 NIPSNAP family protein [Roseomonas fluvialis]
MIVEERDYRLKPGKLGAFVAAYEAHGLPIQIELLGEFLGYFTTEIGELNHVVAWWRYTSFEDRLARRDRMMADPRWQAYLDRVTDLVDVQQTRLLRPTRFSPIQ